MRRTKMALWILILILVFCIAFERMTKPVTTAEMIMRANQTAYASINTLPKNSFTQDGCTLFPDVILWLNFKEACLTHDITYWIGGTTESRSETDMEFLNNLRNTGVLNSPFAYIMYSGVRLFGDTFLIKPFNANWGYGFN